MSRASLVLSILLVLALVGVGYMAARVMADQRQHRSQLRTLQQQLATETERTKQLIPEIRGLQTDLHRVVVRRGRAWYDCVPSIQPNPQGGAPLIQVQLTAPYIAPADKDGKGVLFVFEQVGLAGVTPAADPAAGDPAGEAAADDPSAVATDPAVADPAAAPATAAPADAPRHYLGEFAILAMEGNTLTLAPLTQWTPAQLRRLEASQGPWVVYDLLPSDTHEAFAGMVEDDLRKLLPEASLTEYLRDGQPAEANDPAERIVEQGEQRIVRRALRDYMFLLRDLHRQRTLQLDRLGATQADVARLNAAQAEAEKHAEFNRGEIAELKTARERLDRELAAIRGQLTRLQGELTDARQQIETLLVENSRLAQQLSEAQLRALEAAAPESGPYLDEPAPATSAGL